MDSDGIIKSFDILENKAISLAVVINTESVQPEKVLDYKEYGEDA